MNLGVKVIFYKSVYFIPVSVFAFGICVSVFFGISQNKILQQRANSLFEKNADSMVSEIQRRLNEKLAEILRLRILYDTNNDLKRASFDKFYESAEDRYQFLSSKGIAVIERVHRSELPEFLAAQRIDGAPSFTIKPITDQIFPDLYVVKFFDSSDPDESKDQVQGLDVGSDPLRRQALRRAVETEEATLTGAIRLKRTLQDNAAFMMYLPMYADGAAHGNVTERIGSQLGVLSMPIMLTDIFKNLPDVTQGLLNITVHDNTFSGTQQAIIYASKFDNEITLEKSNFIVSKAMSWSNAHWTLQLASTPKFSAIIDRSTVWMRLAIGFLISLLAALLFKKNSLVISLSKKNRNDFESIINYYGKAGEAKFFEVDSDWFFQTDKNHRFSYFSDNFKDISGIQPELMLGKPRAELTKIFSLNSREKINSYLANIYTHTPFFNSEFETLISTGESRWISVSAHPYFDTDGQFLGFRGAGRMITENKRHELAILSAVSTMTDLTSNIPPMVYQSQCLLDGSFRMPYCNLSVIDICGVGAQEAMANPKLVFDQIHPEDLALVMNSLKKSAKPDEKRCVKFRFRHKRSCQLVWVYGESRARVMPDGSIFWNGSLTDITEMVSVAASLNKEQVQIKKSFAALKLQSEEDGKQSVKLVEAKLAAEEANMRKSTFLAIMSHEFRTPMGGILGLLELLKRSNLNALQLDYTEKAETSALSLLGIIDDILDVSKVEAGKMTLNSEPFNMDKLVSDLKTILSANLRGKSLSLHLDVSPLIPPLVIGDANRLKQVLINLGGNALKFTSQGEVRVKVLIQHLTMKEVVLVFEVSDTGIGMSIELQSRMFEIFTQADTSTSRHYGGTGLGLNISKRLVEMMGGQLLLKSDIGVGSSFSFSLTFVIPKQNELESLDSTELLKAFTPLPLAGLRVLLVEDNLIGQVVVKTLLEQAGAQLSIAQNGQMAVDALSFAPDAFDIVLMDMQMPVMDGLQATLYIRQQLKLTELPIIAMTANVMASDFQKCMDAGMNDHVGKPFKVNDLVATMQNFKNTLF